MCNLYSLTKGQSAVLEFTRAMHDRTGNLPPLPAIFPDTAAPVVRNTEVGHELVMMRWGMPSPAFVLKGKKVDGGVTNIRNTTSPHWRRWLGPEHRCLVPMTSFSKYDTVDGKKVPAWFAANDDRPLMVFAGVWTNWTSTRKVKEGEVNADLYGFLTTEPNAVVAPIHPKAMPVILTTAEEMDVWMSAPWSEAAELQRPPTGRHLEGRREGRAEGRRRLMRILITDGAYSDAPHDLVVITGGATSSPSRGNVFAFAGHRRSLRRVQRAGGAGRRHTRVDRRQLLPSPPHSSQTRGRGATMNEKTLHIVQQFEKQEKNLIAGRAIEFRSSAEAVARAERDAECMAGVVALTQTVDVDTGEVIEEPMMLARYGELPKDFQSDN